MSNRKLIITWKPNGKPRNRECDKSGSICIPTDEWEKIKSLWKDNTVVTEVLLQVEKYHVV